jgi:hypothetical protein
MLDAVFDHTRHIYNELQKQAGNDKLKSASKLTTRNKFFTNSINYMPLKGGALNALSWKIGILKRVYWLDLLEKGGVRKPRSKFVAIPIRKNLKLKKSNAPSKAKRVGALLKRKNHFFTKIKGRNFLVKKIGARGGQRKMVNGKQVGGKLVPLYYMKPTTKYTQKFYSFGDSVNEVNRKKPLNKRMLMFLNGTERAIQKRAKLARKGR